MTKLSMVTQVGRSSFTGISHAPHLKWQAPAPPKFKILYPSPNILTKSDRIWCADTNGVGSSF